VDAQREVRPPVSDDDLAALPAKRGIVVLLAEGDRPILLLPAADMRRRTANRLRDPDQQELSRQPDLHNIVRRIAWKRSHSHFQTDLDYLDLARVMWPDEYAGMLAWKPAWFVHVDLEQDYPCFTRTRDVFGKRGRYLGPFPDGRSAGSFIDALQDAFDLCRDIKCLRSSPHGRQCSYGQMGRCLSPCDGSISAGAYRQAVAEVCAFAVTKDSSPIVRRLEDRMRESARELQFEKAAADKLRLERLKQFDDARFARVRPAEEFRFLMIEHGPKPRELCTFFVELGAVEHGPVLKYPPEPQFLEDLLRLRGSFSPGPFGDAGFMRRRMGLVSHYLFSPPRRGGIIIRYHDGLSAQDLAAAIESAAEEMKLPQPKKQADQDTGPAQ
jgi:excinuclease UvrABC nuclease subunit